MRLSWIFGSTMEAHHLLWAYLSVWLIQGGYCVWTALQWMHTPKSIGTEDPLASMNREDS
jgi:hypothetical protein